MTYDDELDAAYRTVPQATSLGRRLFVALARHPGQIKSNGQLADEVWPDKAIGDDSVYSGIKRLRKLLPEGFVLITHHGAGFSLVVPPKWRLRPPDDLQFACNRQCRELREVLKSFMEAG